MSSLKNIILNKIYPSMPGGLLLVSLLSSYGIIIPDAGYIVGYSFYTSIFFTLTFGIILQNEYSFIPLWCSIGLFVMTLIDWQEEFTNYSEYSRLYDTCIVFLCITVVIFKLITHIKEKKDYQKIIKN